MNRSLCYDLDGNPITWERWAELLHQKLAGGPHWDQKGPLPWWRIGFDKVGPYSVSTVWLGLDHQYGDGPPLIFETMVFTEGPDEKTRDWLDTYTRRYPSKEAALAGHDRIVTEVREQWAGVSEELADVLDAQPREDS